MTRRPVLPAQVVSLRTGEPSSAEARSYPGRSPVLVLGLAGAQLTLSTADPARVTAADVAFARRLAEQAGAYAVACERMYLGRPGATT